jgi:hypothetical protein
MPLVGIQAHRPPLIIPGGEILGRLSRKIMLSNHDLILSASKIGHWEFRRHQSIDGRLTVPVQDAPLESRRLLQPAIRVQYQVHSLYASM